MKNAVAHHTCSHWISMGMSSIEICHEHVFFCNYTLRLFFRFDVAGAGASLKRYSDPSFFKTEQSSNMIESDAIMEKKPRRIKVSKKVSVIAKILLKQKFYSYSS
jgi:hypothetical protein